MSKSQNRSKTIAFTFVFAIVMFISFIALFSISNVNVNALGITVSSNKYVVNKGDTVTISAAGSGGSNLTYQFEVQPPNSTWKKIQNYSASQQANYTFNDKGTYTFRVAVKDNVNPPVSVNATIQVVVYDLVNNSSVSSTQVTLGGNITINGNADGGSGNYKFKYTYHREGDNDSSGNPIWRLIVQTTPDNYTSSSAVSYSINDKSNYTIKVTARDEKTYKTVEKTFNVKVVVDKTKLTNTSTASQKDEIHPGDTYKITASASGGSGQYEYKFVMKLNDGTHIKTEYENFSSNSVFTHTAGNLLGIFIVTVTARDKNNTSNTADKQFTFEIREEKIDPILVSGTIDRTQILTPNNSLGKDTFTLNMSASGGTGSGYHYTYSYKKGSGDVHTFGQERTVSESNGLLDSSSFTGQFKQTGTYTIIVNVSDSRNTVYAVKLFTVTVKQAPMYNKSNLYALLSQVNNWYDNLTRTQKSQFQALRPTTSKKDFSYSVWEKAKNDAQNFFETGNEIDTDRYYNALKAQDELARQQELPSVEESEMFYTVNETISTVMNFLLKGIGGMMVQNFGTTGPEDATIKGFDIQSFVDAFSPIFMIFANSLLVVLFGVNVLGTTLQYELFTLRGGAKLLGRLFLSKIFIDLSCTICMSLIKIAAALLTEVVGKSQDMLYSVGFHFTFMYSSGIPVVGYVIDFLVMIIVIIILFLMFIPLLYFMVKVIVKLFIINFELAGLTAMSPAFFACLSGEETKQYFKNFIVTFLQILGELIFMGIVYAAFIMWYNTVGDLSVKTDISDMNIGGQVGNLITFAIVFIAACHLMVKPPEVFKNLLK